MNADWQLVFNSLKPKYYFMKSHMEATVPGPLHFQRMHTGYCGASFLKKSQLNHFA